MKLLGSSNPLHRASAFALASLIVACGGAPVPPAEHAAATTTPAATPAPKADGDPLPQVRVRGLTGTLNKDDVHQTMDARQPEFDECIQEVRSREAWVEGTIRFDFKVDGEGKVETARPTESTIGHSALERCLTRVVNETSFPRPAGRARASFSWDMQVFPAYSAAEPMDSNLIRRMLARKARDVFRGCKVRRFRNRFDVTAYVGKRGRVLSAGAVPNRPQPQETLECVLQEISSWQMPKPKRRAKVSFLLK